MSQLVTGCQVMGLRGPRIVPIPPTVLIKLIVWLTSGVSLQTGHQLAETPTPLLSITSPLLINTLTMTITRPLTTPHTIHTRHMLLMGRRNTTIMIPAIVIVGLR